ncbi:ribonuclease H-like domain-containing protein, partial [Tanacetum coccineum]
MLCFLLVLLRGINTWQPGEEVLRSLVSRQFISCNKEKSPHICHACHLGKHVRLPFSSSDSVVTHCFEIVIWTSPLRDAMYDEYNALIRNSIWILVPKPPNANVVRSMWLFRHKYHADGSLRRYKTRLIANGRSQQYGVNCDDTFSPVVKPTTIRTLLSLALSQNWPNHQLHVKNAFLNSDLSETVYMHVSFSKEVCNGASGSGTYGFLNPTRTPVDMESKLDANGDPVSDPTFYRSLAGSLQYLTFTRPDISYDVQQVCLHDPREPHFLALKRILRYVRGMLDFGLQLYASSTGSLLAYTDADWAGCPTTRRFTSVAEIAWLRNLLRELHMPLSSATFVYCDNVSAIYLRANPVRHQRTKHIEIDIHFVRDMVARGHVRVLHVPSRYQVVTYDFHTSDDSVVSKPPSNDLNVAKLDEFMVDKKDENVKVYLRFYFKIQLHMYQSWYQEPKFLIKMPPRRNQNINDVYDRIMARIEERLDQFVDQFVDRMNDLMNPKRHGDRNGRRSEGEESEYPFFEGNGSSDEWGDYGVTGDGYEGPPVFDDDQYEEEIVSGDVGKGFVDNYLNFQKDETNVSFSGVVLGVEEESMLVYDTDIEDAIEDEERFVGKRGFDNME